MPPTEPTRFRFVDSDNPWIRLIYLPLLAAAVILEVVRPLPLLPSGRLAAAAGLFALGAAGFVALSGRPEDHEALVHLGGRRLLRRRIYLALPIAVVAVALFINSIWPLILLAAGTVLVIRLLAAQGPGWTDAS